MAAVRSVAWLRALALPGGKHALADIELDRGPGDAGARAQLGEAHRAELDLGEWICLVSVLWIVELSANAHREETRGTSWPAHPGDPRHLPPALRARARRLRRGLPRARRDRRRRSPSASDGEPVVDLWAGHADPARTRPVARDTIVHLYSATKGMTALCAHRLVERGALELDAPVARYWPEFAQRGQGRRSRCAGCSRTAPACRRCASRCRPRRSTTGTAMCAALAAAEPCMPPGQARLPPGDLRLARRRAGAPRRRPQPRPLLPRGDRASRSARTSTSASGPPRRSARPTSPLVAPPPEIAAAFAAAPGRRAAARGARLRQSERARATTTARRHRRAEIPAINAPRHRRGARARLRRARARRRARRRAPARAGLGRRGAQRAGAGRRPAARARRSAWASATGSRSPSVPGYAFGPNEGAFGHPGAGGSIGFADPCARIGFGYVDQSDGPQHRGRRAAAGA